MSRSVRTVLFLIFALASSTTGASEAVLGAELLSASIELALASCRSQFRWDRWNCPIVQFLAKRDPSGASVATLDRETAFVRAIGTASKIYVYARNCSKGGGECGNDLESFQNLQDSKGLVPRLDLKAYGMAHNQRAGWVAVQSAVRKHCRCHGVSGSCAMRTCWSTMKSFAEIAVRVKRMYSNAVRLFVDNSGRLNSGKIRADQLVYIHPSPDFCQRDATPGWPGMVNRQCSMMTSSSDRRVGLAERKSCRNLCRYCGLKVRKKTKVERRKCNCRFSWCCQVVCDNCVEFVEEFRCQ